MAREDYIPNRLDELDTWAENIELYLDAIATALGLDANRTAAVLVLITTMRTKYAAAIAAKNAKESANDAFQIAKKTALTEVRGLMKELKAKASYDDTYGETLDIIGDESTFDRDTAKPKVKLKWAGGNVTVKFSKEEAVGVRIDSKRASETTFTYLATDTHSPYEDNRTNLTPGEPEKRIYKLWYFDNEGTSGLPSDDTSIVVPG